MELVLEQISEALELLFVPILLIELAWLWRRGLLHWARIKEMFANVSSLLFVLPAGFVGFVGWFGLFKWVEGLVPWSLPINWMTGVGAVVLADFIYYWQHRFEHEHRLPWDLWHSVHHSSESFDQTTSLRLGVFDALLTVGFSLPLVVIGFPAELALLGTGFVTAYQTWLHTEIVAKTPRWFEAIFSTPSHHRAHHGADAHYLDANYGGMLIVWDRLFGTFQAETSRPNYGLTTQINSSHPLDVQFSQLRLLWRELQADRCWRTRWRRLWNRPSWKPMA